MSFLDVAPDDERWRHHEGPGAGVRLHYVRRGEGDPVLLLHGWPGFWYDWRRVLPMLEGEADLIAPDLRGFGRSDKPAGDPEALYGPEMHAADLLSLLDHLGIERVTIAAHDIGATIAQRLALGSPARVRSLALCNPPYLGIGDRRFEPRAQREMWYQQLHLKPWAQDLIGRDRETVRVYLSHFYDHWAGRKDAVRAAELDHIVEMYARPGAVRGSIEYYRARAGAKLPGATPRAVPIPVPTVVLWGEEDPVIPAAWSDRIAESFPSSTLTLLPGVGHFVPFEAPEECADAIRRAMRSDSFRSV